MLTIIAEMEVNNRGEYRQSESQHPADIPNAPLQLVRATKMLSFAPTKADERMHARANELSLMVGWETSWCFALS